MGVQVKKLLPSQVMAILGISRETLNQWVARRLLKADRTFPLGWRVFNKSDVDRLAPQLPNKRLKGVALLTQCKVKRLKKSPPKNEES